MPDKTKKHSRLTIDAQQINGKAKCQWCGASYAIERNIIVDGYDDGFCPDNIYCEPPSSNDDDGIDADLYARRTSF